MLQVKVTCSHALKTERLPWKLKFSCCCICNFLSNGPRKDSIGTSNLEVLVR